MNQPKKEEQLDLEIEQQEEAQDVEVAVQDEQENADITVEQDTGQNKDQFEEAKNKTEKRIGRLTKKCVKPKTTQEKLSTSPERKKKKTKN